MCKRTASMYFKPKTLITAILVAIGSAIGYKGYQISKPPTQPKDCDYTYPHHTSSTTTLQIDATDAFLQRIEQGGFANDASCLNRTPLFGKILVKSEQDVLDAITFAKKYHLPITPAGQQHTMGGHSFLRNGLMLDMKGLKGIEINKEAMTMKVKSGTIWEDVQKALDAQGLAVKAMQSINIFTVGGTITVNAHGIAHAPGQIGPTIRSLRIATSDGRIVHASRTENAELFHATIGGYGLTGVILEAELDIVPNDLYTWERHLMNYKEFPDYYQKTVDNNNDIGLFYARLSMAPHSYLKEVVAHTYTKTTSTEPIAPLAPQQHTRINRLIINLSKTGGFGRWTRWMLEKYLEPKTHLCSRNQAMSQKDVCLVTRNQEMYDDMGYLKNQLPDTDILQEYFIPFDQMPSFIDGLRETVQKNRANLLNVTIRIVSKDTDSALPYAKDKRFAFVLYFNQAFTDADSETLKNTTLELIRIAQEHGGAYYLPYQLHYSPETLRVSYPEFDSFIAKKKRFDPDHLFTNTFFEKYGK